MRTVLHLSAGSPRAATRALNNAANLAAAATDGDDVVLLANGDGVYALCTTAPTAERVASLADRGVTFLACGNSLRAHDVAPDELVAGVDVVPSGVVELTRRQEEGYAYIKVP